jgi:hypothetical protein
MGKIFSVTVTLYVYLSDTSRFTREKRHVSVRSRHALGPAENKAE